MKFLRILVFLIVLIIANAAPAIESVITDPLTVFTEPTTSEPNYLGSYIDQNFKTKITRIAKYSLSDGDVAWGIRVRHHYSKDQAWNADMSLLWIINAEGSNPSPSPGNLILDGRTYQFRFPMPVTPDEMRWHPTNPDIVIYTINNQILKYNFADGSYTQIHQFAEYPVEKSAVGFQSEGNLSYDGNWVAFCSRAGKTGVSHDAFAYDIANNIKHPALNIGTTLPDWVSISASGRYVVIDWSDTNTRVYDVNMNFIRQLPLNISHYDLTIDSDGNDVAVGVCKASPYNGKVIKIPLVSGNAIPITTRGYAVHTSARNVNRRGWVYVTYDQTSAESPSWPPYWEEVLAVKLDGTEIHRLGHMHNYRGEYYTEPQAMPSPDGKRVIFASDWKRSGNRPVIDFIIDMRNLSPYWTPPEYTSIIWLDDFESGDFASGGWTNSTGDPIPAVAADANYSGNYGAKITKTGWIEKAISTVGYKNIQLKYARKTSGLDSSEYLYIEWSINGVNWRKFEDTHSNSSWELKDLTCGRAADNQPGFRVRFRTNANDISEYAYIDNVEIVGESIAGDLNHDNQVSFSDFSEFAFHWLEENCIAPFWCEGADLDSSGTVDNVDLAIMAQNWITE